MPITVLHAVSQTEQALPLLTVKPGDKVNETCISVLPTQFSSYIFLIPANTTNTFYRMNTSNLQALLFDSQGILCFL